MSATLEQLFVPNPTTVRAESTKISIDPKGSKLIYCQGRTVIIRNLDDPKETLAYSQHAQPVQVAKISPSGYYCASADSSGKVRVWDLAGKEQILKSEFQVLGGKVKDLSWDGESKRIIAVGEGKEKYGHAFLMDSGSSVGEISGHSKPINAVAMRSQRPFRAVTASDDSSIAFFHGAPYKYQKSISTHSKFVQDVAYAPSGAVFASAGSDGKLFLYEGTSGDTLAELSETTGSGAHKGTIFAIDFSPDSKSLISVGADGSAKLWDVDQKQLIGSWDLTGANGSGTGDKVNDQQVGVTFAGNQRAVSLSFAGELSVLDLSSPSRIKDKIFGSTKSIGVGSLVRAPEAKSLIAGSFDGRVVSFDLDGRCSQIIQPNNASAVTALSSAGNAIFSAGMDGSIKKVDGSTVSSVSTATSQPKSMSCSSFGTVFVAGVTGVDVIGASGKNFTPVPSPQSIASTLDGSLVAVGLENSKVQLFDSDGKSLTLSGELSNGRSSITALAFSPDGSLLAAGESSGKILVYDVKAKSLKLSHWVFHSGRVNSIEFSPDGTHAISGSLDTNAYIWSVLKPTKNIAIKNCHANGVNGVCWLDDEKSATAGADGCVRIHTIKRHS